MSFVYPVYMEMLLPQFVARWLYREILLQLQFTGCTHAHISLFGLEKRMFMAFWYICTVINILCLFTHFTYVVVKFLCENSLLENTQCRFVCSKTTYLCSVTMWLHLSITYGSSPQTIMNVPNNLITHIDKTMAEVNLLW